jgi:hypothetical protein
MNAVLSQRIFPSQQNVQGRVFPKQSKSAKMPSLKQSKSAIDLAIFAYATKHAGTEVDLDRDLENAGIECLARGD